FFGGLPAEMGGDLTKAEQYTRELESANSIAGAKAREILMSEDADYVAFWNSIIQENPENTDAHQALGRVYLFNGDFKQAEKQYKKAIQLDANKNALYLDLGRYFVMQAMQNQDVLDSLAPLAEEQFNKYLNANPKPVQPMKAWTYGSMAMIGRRAGNKEQAAKNIEMAKALDPFFTPAFGKPYGGLFTPPEAIIHFQTYYLSPF
ncbi:MAG: tetratricopeptide repeat protein, partial [Bacteroidales bacterium]|nr:tetratricopeptide repeat protein [Bacteroidales bacterium]